MTYGFPATRTPVENMVAETKVGPPQSLPSTACYRGESLLRKRSSKSGHFTVYAADEIAWLDDRTSPGYNKQRFYDYGV